MQIINFQVTNYILQNAIDITQLKKQIDLKIEN